MKSGGSAPAAPDPQASAAAQSGSNIATAIANARLNRVNQTTPWGSINYTQGATDANGVPSYSSEIKLDPEQQRQLDEQRKQQAQRQQMASALLGNVSTKPLNLSGAHQMYDRYASQQPAQAPPAPQPQAPQSQNPRDAMLAELMQYLQSAGGAGAGAGAGASGNPAMRYSSALRGSASPSTAAATPGAQTPNSAATPQSWEQFMAGRNGLGSSNFSLMDQNDPRHADYFSKLPMGADGEDQRYQSVNPRVGAAGSNEFYVIGPDGKPWYQVGGQPTEAAGRRYLKTDPSAFKYDDEFGVITPRTNLNLHADTLDTVMPYLVAAGLGGPAVGAAMGSGAPSLGVTGGAELGGGAGLTGGGAVEMGGLGTAAAAPAATSGPAPVTDLSTQATQPSMGSRMMTNLQQGRGLFGMNRGVQGALGPLIAQILRGMNSQGGK